MGDLVWQPPDLDLEASGVVQTWRTAAYVATRRFRSAGPSRLEVRFGVENRRTAPMAFLWASHALFSFNGLRRVVFADGSCLEDFSLDD